jgi:hypothetical protein
MLFLSILGYFTLGCFTLGYFRLFYLKLFRLFCSSTLSFFQLLYVILV